MGWNVFALLLQSRRGRCWDKLFIAWTRYVEWVCRNLLWSYGVCVCVCVCIILYYYYFIMQLFDSSAFYNYTECEKIRNGKDLKKKATTYHYFSPIWSVSLINAHLLSIFANVAVLYHSEIVWLLVVMKPAIISHVESVVVRTRKCCATVETITGVLRFRGMHSLCVDLFSSCFILMQVLVLWINEGSEVVYMGCKWACVWGGGCLCVEYYNSYY